MRYPEVEVDSGDEHVGLQSNFVDAGGRESHRDGDHTEQGRRGGFPGVGEGVLWPQPAQNQYHLQTKHISNYQYIYNTLYTSVLSVKLNYILHNIIYWIIYK